MGTNYWLVKQEPESYSWSTLVEEGGTAWTGVRNFQARNHLGAMQEGDLVFFYHSGAVKAVVGLARVSRAAYPDPTAEQGDWVAVDLAPLQPLHKPVPLSLIKVDEILAQMPMVRQSRLSVTPLSNEQCKRMLVLSGTTVKRQRARLR